MTPTINFINTQDELRKSLDIIYKTHPIITLDIESTGLDCYVDRILLIQISVGEQIFVYNVRALDVRPLIEILNLYNGTIVLHNAKFDVKFLRYFYGFTPKKLFDTMIAETLITCGIGKLMSSLKELVLKYLQEDLSKEERSSFNENVIIFTDEQIQYAARDAEVLYRLYPILLEIIQFKKLAEIAEIEHDLVVPIIDMELEGISLDKNVWNKCLEQAKSKMNESLEDLKGKLNLIGNIKVDTKHKGEKVIKEIPPSEVNLNSPIQMKAILHKLGLKVKTTNADELSTLDHEFVTSLLRYRGFAKSVSTYGENFFNYINPIDNRIHTTLNQIGAATGRISSEDPNLQNQKNPGKLKPWETLEDIVNYREAFIAEPGWVIITSDYSQIELRLAAEVSKEPKFIDNYLQNGDLHRLTASLAFEVTLDKVTTEQRNVAKNINFAVLYGSGPQNLVRKFHIPLQIAKRLLENFNKGYPVLAEYLKYAGQQTVIDGYSSTILGRRRNFQMPSMNDPEFEQKLAAIRREGTNHIIQGSSADMTKLAINYLWKDLSDISGKAVLTVHDEIVSKVPAPMADIGSEMVKAAMIRAGERMIHTIPVQVGLHVANCWSK